MLKGQDTEYGGILYRSRLEASWAEFFDGMQVCHKYEYERVDLGKDRYTPDFWLKDFGIWVEIKPYRQKKAHDKCYRLAIETRRRVLLIQGKPEHHLVDMFDPNARLKSTYRTVVSADEIKPSKECFQLQAEGADENVLVLVNSATGETIRLVHER